MNQRLKKLYGIFLSILIFAAAPAFAASTPVNQKFASLRQNFLARISPLVQSETGLDLKIHLDQETPNYFGGMKIENGNLILTVGSEAHLEPEVTLDSYTALLCHEVGHRLGGPPFKKDSPVGQNISTEGQSDYYAARTCLPFFFSLDPLTEIMNFDHLPPELANDCSQSASHSPQVCLRTIQAGLQIILSIHAIYKAYPNPPPPPDLRTPEAPGRSHGSMYPSMQCRLDTYVQGALGRPQPACWYPQNPL